MMKISSLLFFTYDGEAADDGVEFGLGENVEGEIGAGPGYGAADVLFPEGFVDLDCLVEGFHYGI